MLSFYYINDNNITKKKRFIPLQNTNIYLETSWTRGFHAHDKLPWRTSISIAFLNEDSRYAMSHNGNRAHISFLGMRTRSFKDVCPSITVSKNLQIIGKD